MILLGRSSGLHNVIYVKHSWKADDSWRNGQKFGWQSFAKLPLLQLAFEDAKSKLVEVVAVSNVDDEDDVGSFFADLGAEVWPKR